jgi:hypothetical protein
VIIGWLLTCLTERGKWLFVAEQRSHYRSNWMALSAKTGWNFSEWLFRTTLAVWDLQVATLLSNAACRMYIWYILRVCRSYSYTKENLNLLFETLILSLFHYVGIEVWGSALHNKYLQCNELINSQLVEEKDKSLFVKIVKDPDHVLYNLLPERRSRTLRERKHSFILPMIKTERFKRSFLNRCLFDYFN